MRLSLVTAPTAEPVTLEEAKDHLRITGTTHDAKIGALLSAVRQHVEEVTGRQLMKATWDGAIDDFPGPSDLIVLPKAPLQSVTSITYVDGDGATATFSASSYSADAPAGPAALPGRIVLGYQGYWPVPRRQRNAVTVRFVAGYSASATVTTQQAAVPAGLKSAILQGVGELFERREDNTVGTIVTPNSLTMDYLLWPYRVWVPA